MKGEVTVDSLNERKLFRISVIIVLVIAVIASMIISLIWGSTPVSLSEIWHTLWASELTDTASQIIWNIRLPRNIVAALVGACLAAVITAVTFRLSRTPRPNLGYDALAREVEDAGGATLENIRTAVRRIRGEKLPDPAVTGNAGSFFKNPVVDSELAERIKRKYPDMPSYPVPEGVKIPAGWLIEKTGWKGASLGRAGVYGKQALILVNLGGATGNEVTALARRITDDVETRFGIRIATEVNIW